jgi:hypothetical protein
MAEAGHRRISEEHRLVYLADGDDLVRHAATARGWSAVPLHAMIEPRQFGWLRPSAQIDAP